MSAARLSALLAALSPSMGARLVDGFMPRRAEGADEGRSSTAGRFVTCGTGAGRFGFSAAYCVAYFCCAAARARCASKTRAAALCLPPQLRPIGSPGSCSDSTTSRLRVAIWGREE